LSSPRRATQSKPVHRSRRTSSRGSRSSAKPRWILRISLFAVGFLAALILWAALARAFAPLANTNRQNFDAILVLGTPADSDGNPSPELLDRVTEGVHEYQRGVAPRIIVTGGAAHNRFTEARVMARVAQAQGVPAAQIIEEPQALDTIQNACYSSHILASHGWHSVEVITSSYHLPRAAMIVSRLSSRRLEWRTHAAPASLTPGIYNSAANLVEIFKTARYLAWARWIESCSP